MSGHFPAGVFTPENPPENGKKQPFEDATPMKKW